MSSNGVPIIGGAPPNPLADYVCTLLKEVEAGRVTSLAIVAVAPTGGVATTLLGGQLGDMYVGAAILQHDVMSRIKGQTAAPPGLVRAAAMPMPPGRQ